MWREGDEQFSSLTRYMHYSFSDSLPTSLYSKTAPTVLASPLSYVVYERPVLVGVIANLALVSDRALVKKRVCRRRTAPDSDAFNRRLAERVYELHVSLALDQDNVVRKTNLYRAHASRIEDAKANL